MVFCSTRDTTKKVTGSAAIVEGIAPDGGLYVPMEMPNFSKTQLDELSKLTYQELTATILVKFLPELGFEPLLAAAKAAYASEKFGGEVPVKVTNLLGRQSVLELWHGPTYAFKDMALQLLPHLLRLSLAAVGEKKQAPHFGRHFGRHRKGRTGRIFKRPQYQGRRILSGRRSQ